MSELSELRLEVLELVAQFQAQLKEEETDLELLLLDFHYRDVFLWSEQAPDEAKHAKRLKILRDAISRRQKVYLVTITFTTVQPNSDSALAYGSRVLDDWRTDQIDDDAIVSVDEFYLEEEEEEEAET